ncbi:hypothetical protein M758_UG078500 [Ceratodon purpureus]|nr:hypothetical protein M758_UG078500 [Ceratodon purpureus]
MWVGFLWSWGWWVSRSCRLGCWTVLRGFELEWSGGSLFSFSFGRVLALENC